MAKRKSKSKDPVKVFIVMWSVEGLEGVVDASGIEHNNLIEALKTGSYPKVNVGHYINMMTLRAQYNTHRHYEIYSVPVAMEISEDDLRSLFEQTPQEAADLCRKYGTEIYSARAHPDKFVIK